MARTYKMKTLDDGARVRVHQKQPYQGSEIKDGSGRPAVGSPIVERFVSSDSPGGTVPLHPIDPRVLDGTNPHRFLLDANNRPVMAEGRVLNMGHMRNDDAQRSVSGPFRDAGGDVDATHLIARSMGGPGGFENLVPASEVTNRQEIRDLEKKLEAMVAADPGREIFVQVRVEYGGDHAMPTALHYNVFERKGGQVEAMEERSFYVSH